MAIVIVGSFAASLVFSTFFMRTMIPLRMAAIASNLAFVSYALLGLAYGVFDRLLPILVLHACLLPLNLIRLREVARGLAAVRPPGADDPTDRAASAGEAGRHAGAPSGYFLWFRGKR